MAKVFISYRHADGQYPVGWIEERLQRRQIDDVATAFRDSELQFGEEFPQRLVHEVEQCKVLLAVIGPNWRGVRANGPDRILDPDDWVGREIASALEDEEKLIIPVLLSGVDAPQADELAPRHRRFADFHACRFDDESSLTELVERVSTHLDTLSARQAELDGFLDPVELPSDRLPWRAWLLAAVAAVVGALVGRWVATFAAGVDETEDLGTLADISSFQLALWSFLGVLGAFYYHRVLAEKVTIHWRSAVLAAAIAILFCAWAIVAFGVSSTARGGAARTWIQAALALALMSPWIVTMLSAGWSNATATSLGSRVRVVATQRRALSRATPAVVAALVPSIVATAELTDDGNSAPALVAFGFFVSLLVGGALEYSHAALRHESELLRPELTREFEGEYREHAMACLVENDRRDLWGSLMWWALVPTVVAVITALAYWG